MYIKILAILFAIASVVSNPFLGHNHFYELPITTWEEAYNYTYMMLGGTEPNICESIGGSLRIGSGEIPQVNNLYGVPIYFNEPGTDDPWQVIGYGVNLECELIDEYDEQGRPKSGHLAFDFDFDPNDGFIHDLSCSPDDGFVCENTYYDTGVIKQHGIEQGYTCICGDGHCGFSQGEDYINCPEDCEKSTEDIKV